MDAPAGSYMDFLAWYFILVLFTSLTCICSVLVPNLVKLNLVDSFFDAVYWATVSLTTVGYGDIYTVTVTGKIITMISSVLGIAIVALPAGIITAGYTNEIAREEEEEEEKRENHEAAC